VTHYAYRIRTVAQGQTTEATMSYSISSTTLNGKGCWLQEMSMQSKGMTIKYRVWLDKTSLECLKAEMSANNGPWQTLPCYQVPTGTSTTTEGEPQEIQVREVGHETITVPAGTFSCTVYEATTSTGTA